MIMIVTTAISQSNSHRAEHFLHRSDLAANIDSHAFRWLAGGFDGLIDLASRAPKIFAFDIGGQT